MPDSDSNAYKPQQSVPSLDPNPNNLLNADEKKRHNAGSLADQPTGYTQASPHTHESSERVIIRHIRLRRPGRSEHHADLVAVDLPHTQLVPMKGRLSHAGGIDVHAVPVRRAQRVDGV